MKAILSLLVCFGLVLAVATPVMAQKPSKEEKKRMKEESKMWKSKAKSYGKTPLQLRDDLEALNEQIKQLSDKNKELMTKLSNCNSQVDSLQGALNSKIAELAALEKKYEQLQTAYAGQKNVNTKGIIPGLVYTVQIGAFVHFDINKYLQETENFEGETADGMNKYLLGRFKEVEVAENFKKDIRKMGIRDAWVVPYIDGVRVTHEEAKKYQERG